MKNLPVGLSRCAHASCEDPLENLRYPVRIHRIDNHFTFIATGATTDQCIAIKEVFIGFREQKDFPMLWELLSRKLSEVQMDQCARECRNLWGPIWGQIWREVWEFNSLAMARERNKALMRYFE